MKQKNKVMGTNTVHFNTTHGKKYSSEYAVWRNIKARCRNKNNPSYKDYGGRGIDICDTWFNSFEEFYKEMGDKPSVLNSIERRNNNLGYFKDNCYWGTRTEQNRNRSTTVWIECRFGRLTQHDLAVRLGVTNCSIRYRLRKGESPNEIISHFRKRKKRLHSRL